MATSARTIPLNELYRHRNTVLELRRLARQITALDDLLYADPVRFQNRQAEINRLEREAQSKAKRLYAAIPKFSRTTKANYLNNFNSNWQSVLNHISKLIQKRKRALRARSAVTIQAHARGAKARRVAAFLRTPFGRGLPRELVNKIIR